jgi:hypothetical protein
LDEPVKRASQGSDIVEKIGAALSCQRRDQVSGCTRDDRCDGRHHAHDLTCALRRIRMTRMFRVTKSNASKPA